VKALFTALHFGYFRNFESVIRALSARGHSVHLTADEPETMGGRELVERMAAECPGVSYGFAPRRDDWPWMPFAHAGRRALEFIRFLHPRYERIVKYRARTRERAPIGLVRLFGGRRPAESVQRWCASALAAIERGIPTSPALDEFIAEQAPDLVLLASVTNPGALQLDLQKSAMAAGRHHALTIFSWDHLSGKAWLKLQPERVLVWNSVQQQEAVDLHGLPLERIVVTGAQCYDQWFERSPSRSREEFCADLGLRADVPLLLYVCSVLSRPAPPEAPFVLEWIEALRRSADERVRSAAVLIRPHPERLREWDGIDLTRWPDAALRGRNPVDAAAKADYFDALYHSSAVVGLVTSAFVEAAVVGRPTLTIQTPEFAVHQEGTTHFGYLVNPEYGVALTAPDVRAHVAQLSQVLSDPEHAADRSRRFVNFFVRPGGADRRATDVFVQAVEEIAALPPPVPVRFGGGVAGRVAEHLRRLAGRPRTRRWFLSEKELADERQRLARSVEEQRLKADAVEDRRARHDARRAHEEEQARRDTARKAELHAAREAQTLAKRKAADERKRMNQV